MKIYRFRTLVLPTVFVSTLLAGCSAGAGTQEIDKPEKPFWNLKKDTWQVCVAMGSEPIIPILI